MIERRLVNVLDHLVEAEIGHFGKSILQLLLDKLLELVDLVHRARLVVVDLFEVVVTFMRHIEFDGVVTRRDRHHVEIEEHVLLDSARVVEVDNDEEVNEDADASDSEAAQLPDALMLLRDDAGNLNEEVTVLVAVILDCTHRGFEYFQFFVVVEKFNQAT